MKPGPIDRSVKMDRPSFREALELMRSGIPDRQPVRTVRVDITHIPADQAPGVDVTLEEIERWHVHRVCLDAKGNMMQAAKRLGISRAGLYRKMIGLRLNVDEFRALQQPTLQENRRHKAMTLAIRRLTGLA